MQVQFQMSKQPATDATLNTTNQSQNQAHSQIILHRTNITTQNNKRAKPIQNKQNKQSKQ